MAANSALHPDASTYATGVSDFASKQQQSRHAARALFNVRVNKCKAVQMVRKPGPCLQTAPKPIYSPRTVQCQDEQVQSSAGGAPTWPHSSGLALWPDLTCCCHALPASSALFIGRFASLLHSRTRQHIRLGLCGLLLLTVHARQDSFNCSTVQPDAHVLTLLHIHTNSKSVSEHVLL